MGRLRITFVPGEPGGSASRALRLRGVLCVASMSLSPLAGTASAQTQTFNYSGSIVSWNVPTTGLYRITAYGASGGASRPEAPRGRGAMVEGEISITANTTLSILVGGRGGDPLFSGVGAGGGGGSFVVAPGNVPLLVAGGAGGGGVGTGGDGLAIAAANPDGSGGTGGNDGDSGGGSGGGGGGFLTSGLTGPTSFPGSNGTGGASFLLGGFGGFRGSASAVDGGNGGFGGGGGGGGGTICGGGGGGYNGGNGGDYALDGGQSGTGGTSFFAPGMINTFGLTGGNTFAHGNGYVEITLVPAPGAAALLGIGGALAARRRRR